jgi:fatty acid desaturase
VTAVATAVLYILARSFYAILTFILIWGSLIWTPLGTLIVTIFFLQLVSRIEEIEPLERWCRRLRIAGKRSLAASIPLRNAEDIHLVVFLAFTVVDYVSAFYVYLHFDALMSGGVFAKVCFVLGAGTMLGWTAGINLGVVFHNHLHCGVARSPRANKWLGRLWTVPSGWPSYFWFYKHVAVHHKHVGEAIDWVQPRLGHNGRYESIHRYIFCHWPWRYAGNLWRDFTGANVGRNATAGLELALFLPLWIAPFMFDPVMGLVLWLYPHWFGSAFILGTGMYTQHVGGTTERKHSGATTFLSEFFNLTMFNVGYHTEHHACPSIHWSELPDLHERLRQELIDGGAHIVPYGSYRAGRLLSSFIDRHAAFDEFRKQHPGYLPGDTNAQPMPAQRADNGSMACSTHA